MTDNDLIRRMDAIQACQVGPSDEWSRSTKGGYNQAATDCAMNILKIAPTRPAVTLADALAVPEVAALVEAAEDVLTVSAREGKVWPALRAAIAQIKGER